MGEHLPSKCEALSSTSNSLFKTSTATNTVLFSSPLSLYAYLTFSARYLDTFINSKQLAHHSHLTPILILSSSYKVLFL
jgi:hypothetical protein